MDLSGMWFSPYYWAGLLGAGLTGFFLPRIVSPETLGSLLALVGVFALVGITSSAVTPKGGARKALSCAAATLFSLALVGSMLLGHFVL